jgi:hypothetical protein
MCLRLHFVEVASDCRKFVSEYSVQIYFSATKLNTSTQYWYAKFNITKFLEVSNFSDYFSLISTLHFVQIFIHVLK